MSRSKISVAIAGLAILAADASRADKPIRNDAAWTDTDGNPISCHDGGISRFGDTFYWYGTSYKGNPSGLWGRKAAHLQNGFNTRASTSPLVRALKAGTPPIPATPSPMRPSARTARWG
jgi:hypothetical protein